MPPTNSARRTRGKRRGQFCSEKIAKAQENVLEAITKVRLRRQQSQAFAPADISTQENESGFDLNTTRFMNLGTVGSAMWCQKCKIPLSLSHVVGEKKQGAASELDVQCVKCKTIHKIQTSGYSEENKSFEINSKLAVGMIDAGVNETQMNTILAAIDAPTISSGTLKAYERKEGSAIEATAKESCIRAIQLEKKPMHENEPEQSI